MAAAAWAGRVAVAVPRDGTDARRIDPFALQDPWRSFVRSAQQAQTKFDDAVHSAARGPLRDRMNDIGGRLGDAVQECWRVARQGQALADARRELDTPATERELAALDRSSPSYDKTAEALQAQLASARRLETTINDARDRLRLLDARMDEAVARAIELSVRGVTLRSLRNASISGRVTSSSGRITPSSRTGCTPRRPAIPLPVTRRISTVSA